MSGNNQINSLTPSTDSEQRTSDIKLECGLCKTRNARELNHCSTKNIIIYAQCSFSVSEIVDSGWSEEEEEKEKEEGEKESERASVSQIYLYGTK